MAKTTKPPSNPKPKPVSRPVSRQKNVTGPAKKGSTKTRGVFWDYDYKIGSQKSLEPGPHTLGYKGKSLDDMYYASTKMQKKSGQGYNTYSSGRGLGNTTVVKQADINTGAYRKRKGH